MVIWYGDEQWPCYIRGSGTALKYNNRYFVICTKHQFEQMGDSTYEHIGLLDKDGHMFTSSAGVQTYIPRDEAELEDILLLDFTEPCLHKASLQERFFNFIEPAPGAMSTDIICYIASGYPSKELDYDFAEKRHLGFKQAIVPCRVGAQKDQSKFDPSRRTMKPINPITFDPDGLSGGSVFAIIANGLNFNAYFAGVIVRAGKDYIHFVPAGFIKQTLDAWIDTH